MTPNWYEYYIDFSARTVQEEKEKSCVISLLSENEMIELLSRIMKLSYMSLYYAKNK